MHKIAETLTLFSTKPYVACVRAVLYAGLLKTFWELKDFSDIFLKAYAH